MAATNPAQAALPGTARVPAPPVPTYTTRALLEALERHYIGPEPLPGGVFLTEVQVPDAGTMRRADGVYLSFVRSAGVGIDVCEIKTSRGDFQRELDNPRKAEAWWNYSTRYWIVSPHPTVTPPELMPDGWGLMCPTSRGRRFKVHRAPSVRDPQVDLTLLIEVAKKMDLLRANLVATARHKAEQVAEEKYRQWRDAARSVAVGSLDDDDRERLKQVAEIERLAGIRLVHGLTWRPDHQTPEQFATTLRLAAAVVGEQAQAARKLKNLSHHAAAAVEVAQELLQHVNAAIAANQGAPDA